MTPDRTDANPDENAEHGVLDESGNLDTASITILGGHIAQVSVDLPVASHDDDADDDVVEDEIRSFETIGLPFPLDAGADAPALTHVPEPPTDALDASHDDPHAEPLETGEIILEPHDDSSFSDGDASDMELEVHEAEIVGEAEGVVEGDGAPEHAGDEPAATTGDVFVTVFGEERVEPQVILSTDEYQPDPDEQPVLSGAADEPDAEAASEHDPNSAHEDAEEPVETPTVGDESSTDDEPGSDEHEEPAAEREPGAENLSTPEFAAEAEPAAEELSAEGGSVSHEENPAAAHEGAAEAEHDADHDAEVGLEDDAAVETFEAESDVVPGAHDADPSEQSEEAASENDDPASRGDASVAEVGVDAAPALTHAPWTEPAGEPLASHVENADAVNDGAVDANADAEVDDDDAVDVEAVDDDAVEDFATDDRGFDEGVAGRAEAESDESPAADADENVGAADTAPEEPATRIPADDTAPNDADEEDTAVEDTAVDDADVENTVVDDTAAVAQAAAQTPAAPATGAVPTTSGAVLTATGSVPTASGAVPTTSGSVPTTSGAVPTTTGAVPRTRAERAATGVIGTVPLTRREVHQADEAARVGRAHALERVRTPGPDVTLTSKRSSSIDDQRESPDLLTADRLLDPRQVARPEPEGLWQQLVYSISGHRINLGDGRRARQRKELDRRISAPLAGGARFVPVLSRKGGVGKTTVTSLLGMALADARDDRVIAVDANPDRGTLADRVGRPNGRTVRDLVRAHDEVDGYHDVSSIVARDATRLDVLASDSDPRVSEAFSDDDYRQVADVAAHYYSIVLTDTGTGIVHSVMEATLERADSLVIVAGLSVDEARLASETLTWLETNGYAERVRSAIVVLNSARPGTPLVRESELEAHFRTRVQTVIRMPYDPRIAAGSAITFRELQPETRQAARELAAAVVEGLRAPAAAA